MNSIRSALILMASAATLGAQAATTRPTTAQAGIVLVAGTDLVIDSIGLVVPPGLGTGAEADGNRVVASGLYVVARVTNRGRERWASRGSIGFSLTAGREEDAARAARRAPTAGVAVKPGAPGIVSNIMAPFGPFSAQATIPGSLAPGESRIVRTVVGNRNEQSRLIFERDKYYTVIATVRAVGDVDESNNRSVRVGRIDANHRGLLVQWEPIANRPMSNGSVQVNAPRRP